MRAKAKYRKFSKIEEAPGIADCLTAVSYIYHRCTRESIALDYIGNMPRSLASQGWKILQTDLSQIEAGDLIFLGDRKRKIAHVALALSDGEAFHCSWKKNGAIESWEDLFSRYRLPKDPSTLMNYVDRRAINLKMGENSQP